MRSFTASFNLILPLMLFVFVSTSIFAQTKEQLEEIKRFEHKLELNKNNPNFDYTAGKAALEELKMRYGVKIENATKTEGNNTSTFSTAVNPGNSKEENSTLGLAETKDTNEKVDQIAQLKAAQLELKAFLSDLNTGKIQIYPKHIAYLEKSIARGEMVLEAIASGKIVLPDSEKIEIEKLLQESRVALSKIKK